MASETPKSLNLATPLAFKPPNGGVPWDYLRKIFRGCQQMAKVPKGVEKLPKMPTG